ncbi:hypothetical protein SKAU_G00085600 [Synaphobranchus kaupii]|uniref:BHLH domain-containing protein n=1 Tax=Synaphobranchus kaupii TaxID=118154 RepID=A0A9Q1FVV4_SYNKA|nr:hypothetical protein SKAU_G00085600 [Synaphobranchus kaupii]
MEKSRALLQHQSYISTRAPAFPRGMKMTATYESKKYHSNQSLLHSQVAVSVLLIGDNDVVIKTSGILWDTLPRFGDIRVVKLAPMRAVPFVDPNIFQLLFFHLTDSNVPTELRALHELRGKSCKHSGKAVYVLVVPEAVPDVPDSAADFVLTQPVTVETVEEVLRRCSFLSEQSQNNSYTSASPNTVVGQKSEPEATYHQAKPGSCVQERSRAEGPARTSVALPQGSSAELRNGDLQAFLHSKKEQKRRLQIKESCERLQELLPFVRHRMDTASTLELTVKYMTYLRQRLPQDILDKVVKALEENGTETWYKPTKAPKKRTTCRPRNKPRNAPKPVPTDQSFADDFIAAHVLGRHIQPKVQGLQPTSSPPLVLMGPPFDPPPDPNVALGQPSGPFGQTFGTNQAYSEQAVMDPSCVLPVFWKQACGPVSSMMVNQNFVPHMVHNPSMAQALIVEESSLPLVQTLMVGPEFLPAVGLDPGYPPPAQPVMMNQTFAPLGSLNDPCPLEITTILPPACTTVPRGVSDYRPITTAATWHDPLLSEILYDSAPSLLSLSSSHSTIRVDNLPQSSTPEPLFSTSLSGPTHWDFSWESGPLYPLQPYLLESVSPASITYQIPAHNAPDPGSVNQFLGEVSTTKLYGQYYTGVSDYPMN